VGFFEESGIGNIVKNLCSNLVAKNYSVSVGVLAQKYVLTDIPVGCKVFYFTKHVTLSRLFGGLALSQDWQSNIKGDIIHHHQGSLIMRKLPFENGGVILHYHGANPRFEENAKVMYEARQIRRHASKAAAIITVSQFAKRELQELFNVRSEIDVIYPGVDTESFTTELPAKYRRGTPSFLFVGALVKKKAINRLLDAIATVRKENPDAFLRVIGTGPRFYELRDQIRRLDLERNTEIVTSWVSRRELPLYYASCDAYVSASVWESFGLPVLEAMACGKPVVGPSVGSYPEIISESSAGAVYESQNVEDLAKTMTKIASHAEEYKTKARDYALKHTWRNMTDEIEKVYRKVSQV